MERKESARKGGAAPGNNLGGPRPRNCDRIFYCDRQGYLISVPTRWTSVEAEDPIVVVSAGRSMFRVTDYGRQRWRTRPALLFVILPLTLGIGLNTNERYWT